MSQTSSMHSSLYGSQASLSSSGQFFTCGICFESYNTPKVLPCLHTFCEGCLDRYVPAGSISLTCPVCRQPSILPEKGVSELQNNYFIATVMEVFEQSSPCVCSANGTVKCMTCNQFLCDGCVSKHNEEHQILTISQLAVLEEQNKANATLMCPKHSSQTLRFYCRDCETAICVTCTDIEHSGHITTRLREAVEEQKIELKRLVEGVNSRLPQFRDALQDIDQVSHSLSFQYEKVLKKIIERFDQVLDVLQQRKNLVCQELEQVHSMKQGVLDEQKNAIDIAVSNITTTCDVTDNALSHGSETDVILVSKELSEKLQEFSTMDIKVFPEENDYLAFIDDDPTTIKRSILNFGCIQTSPAVAHETTASGEGLKLCTIGRQTLVNVIAKDRRGDIVKSGLAVIEAKVIQENGVICNGSTSPEVVNQKNGSYDILYTIPAEGKYLLEIKLFGRHIKSSPFHIRAVPEEESMSSGDRPVCSKIPRTTGVRQRTSNAHSYSRSNGSCRKANPIEDDLIAKIGYRGRNRGEFTNPQGVCCTSTGHILVADSNNQCVQVFSAEGKCELRFGIRGRSPGQMQRPTGVAITSSGNYVVADYENKWVSVFEPTGKFISRIGHGKLLGPKGVTVDHNGHIVVVDNKGSTVLVFQENGKLLYRFGTRGSGNGKFAGPHYAAVNSKNQVVVSDFHNHCIKIYDFEGTFVSSFGSNGEGNGQFNAPTGVAVDSQDNIIVADWGNSRIQVFDSSGSFLSFVNTYADPLYGPQGLSISHDGFVVVADSGNHCLKVYKYLQ